MKIAAYQFEISQDILTNYKEIENAIIEYFRELYREKTDINIVIFYDVSDYDDLDRYQMIKGHLQTRAVEHVTTTISVNAISPYQTAAPTAVFENQVKYMRNANAIKQAL